MINKWDLKTIDKSNQSKMTWLDNYNKPRIYSPQLHKRLIKSMEKDAYLICLLNDLGVSCAGVSSENA